MTDRIKEIVRLSIQTKQDLLQYDDVIENIGHAVEAIVQAYRSGRRLYICGNGGSAADAQHIAAEFTGRFYKDRPALPAEALHGNASYVTAVTNDYGFEQVYSRMIEGIGQVGDVLIALSTSGNSPNIVMACEAAYQKGMIVIGLTGDSGGKMAQHCHLLLDVPSVDTPRIQECHILIGHIICELVEGRMTVQST